MANEIYEVKARPVPEDHVCRVTSVRPKSQTAKIQTESHPYIKASQAKEI